MGPTWGPPGTGSLAAGPRWAPCWTHEPCYLRCYMYYVAVTGLSATLFFFCVACFLSFLFFYHQDLFSVMSNLQTYYHFKLDFQKVGQHTGGEWLIHGFKTLQGQSVAKPGTPLYTGGNRAKLPSSIWRRRGRSLREVFACSHLFATTGGGGVKFRGTASPSLRKDQE